MIGVRSSLSMLDRVGSWRPACNLCGNSLFELHLGCPALVLRFIVKMPAEALHRKGLSRVKPLEFQVPGTWRVSKSWQSSSACPSCHSAPNRCTPPPPKESRLEEQSRACESMTSGNRTKAWTHQQPGKMKRAGLHQALSSASVLQSFGE